jgi:hypothetical protein
MIEDVFDVIGMIVVVAIVVAITMGIGRGNRYRLGARYYRTLPELVKHVKGLVRLDEEGSYPRLSYVVFEGRLASGRKAKISFYEEAAGSSTNTYVRLQVSAEGVPDLRVSLETIATRVGKWIGAYKEIEIGDAEFDERYLLETKTPDQARKALARSHEIKRAIHMAFANGAERFAFEPGCVQASFRVEKLAPELYLAVLSELDQAARTFDRVTIKVKGFEGERRAAVDALGKMRCPYCRAGITGEDDALSACGTCKTVLHEACWEEHGGCPILGCTGRDPERRSRARQA